ncbi:hypothetical protein B566_EDAN010898 [Ephemera danica]|nr:hypothetical protein B566_EDAN010898 [Ephemera danica]
MYYYYVHYIHTVYLQIEDHPKPVLKISMSFSEKLKDKKKNKFLYKDRGGAETSLASATPVKQTIILAKPDREKDIDEDKGDKLQCQNISQSEGQNMKGMSTLSASFTIKTRDPDSRAVSPSCQKAPSVLRKECDVPAPTYQIASKPSPVEVPSNPLQLPPSMLNCVKLIDDNMQICEAAMEHLVDQNDFLVIGVVGAHGVGKSYIMSALADRPGVFPSFPHEKIGASSNSTKGVDMFVTDSRMILLDTPPINSTAMMDYMGVTSQLDKKLAGELAPSSSENALELQSAQLCSFLLAVCHVIIVVDAMDTAVLRCLVDSEMLKPITSTTSGDDQIIEYFPHVVFLQNRTTLSNFMPSYLKKMEESILLVTDDSRLQKESGMSIATGKVIAQLTPDSVEGCLNLFLLPPNNDDDKSDKFRGHPGFGYLAKVLRHQILSASHQSLTTTPLSERNWFHYASKTLDGVKKSALFMEYSRFLP